MENLEFIRAALRFLLSATIAGLSVMALVFLRNRRLNWFDLIAWALVALFAPVVGPLMVLLMRPGRSVK